MYYKLQINCLFERGECCFDRTQQCLLTHASDIRFHISLLAIVNIASIYAAYNKPKVWQYSFIICLLLAPNSIHIASIGGCHLLVRINVACSVMILDSFSGQVVLRQLQSTGPTPTAKNPHNDALLDQVCMTFFIHY